MDQFHDLCSKNVNSWSLPVITLTCIAVALPNIAIDKANSLFKIVDKGLFCVGLVEDYLNNASEHVKTRRVATILWNEIEVDRKWLKNSLERSVFEGKTLVEILSWFIVKAEKIMEGFDFPRELIVANSMYCVARTMLHMYRSNIKQDNERNSEQVREEYLFALLRGMIADLLVACFTNIPRVIMMKSRESVIEKRDASVETAAELLGRTTKIVKMIKGCEIPEIDENRLAFIDEWRLYLKQSIPYNSQALSNGSFTEYSNMFKAQYSNLVLSEAENSNLLIQAQ